MLTTGRLPLSLCLLFGGSLLMTVVFASNPEVHTDPATGVQTKGLGTANNTNEKNQKTKTRALPLIEENQIVFMNGSMLSYDKHRRVHELPVNAYRKHEPIWYEETPVVMEHWRRVIVTKYMNFFEGGSSEIRFYNFDGQLLSPATAFRGSVIIAGPTGRVLLGQKSNHYRLDKSYLLNTEGQLVKRIHHPPYNFGFGSSEDGEIFWILSRSSKEGKPSTLITVVDRNGDQLHFWETTQTQRVAFTHQGKNYEFDVMVSAN